MAKDVKPEDWITFVNYLLPDYYSSVNNDVADRKLKAELIDERMHRLTLGQNDVSRTDLDQVNAQLEPLRTDCSRRLALKTDVHATTELWNEGFFLPRGIKIRLVGSELAVDPDDRGVYSNGKGDSSTIPGAWIPCDHELPGVPSGESRAPRRGWSFGGIKADSRGFKLGPIEADNSGIRMGNMLMYAQSSGSLSIYSKRALLTDHRADHKGFRFGKDRFIADHNGLTVGGRSFGRRASHEPETHTHKRDTHHHFNRREVHHSNMRENHCGHGRGRGRHANRESHQHHSRSHSHGRHRRRRGRDSSTSSSSSSSSSSSEDSQSSLESLPDYDDLPDQQLYIARKALLDWLNHPEQPISRDTVRNIKEDFKMAKRTSPEKNIQDIEILRKDVKELMKKFKEKKREQRHLQRELKREKRAAKRAAKRERRITRREERKWRRSVKGKAKDETWNPPSRMKMPTSPTMDHRAPPVSNSLHAAGRRFPFSRAASAPFIQKLPFDNPGAPPNFPGAMHGGWSVFPYQEHTPDVGFGPRDHPASISRWAAEMHSQAIQMDLRAVECEKRAIEIRAMATEHDVPEPVRVAKRQEATGLEDVAEAFRREAKMLGAEGTLLDEELARELGGVDDVGQDGIVSSH